MKIDKKNSNVNFTSPQQLHSYNHQMNRNHDEYDYDELTAVPSRVLRKVDRRLIPLLFTTYMLSFMDKTILSSASVFGLIEDTVKELTFIPTVANNLSIWSGSSIAGCPVFSTLDIFSGNGYDRRSRSWIVLTK